LQEFGSCRSSGVPYGLVAATKLIVLVVVVVVVLIVGLDGGEEID
jgi:hypothetical protein